jgi:hypothetical protein
LRAEAKGPGTKAIGPSAAASNRRAGARTYPTEHQMRAERSGDLQRMSHAVRGPLVVDTGVFGARLSPRGKSLALSYQPLLEGRATVISFVTVAELRFGAKLAGWGPSRFLHLEYELGRVDIAWPGEALADVDAELRAGCVTCH